MTDEVRLVRLLTKLELLADEHEQKAGYTGMHAERAFAYAHAATLVEAELQSAPLNLPDQPVGTIE